MPTQNKEVLRIRALPTYTYHPVYTNVLKLNELGHTIQKGTKRMAGQYRCEGYYRKPKPEEKANA